MPLQNRVTPLGDIVADPHRGLFTGNRGIIHDPATKTLLKKRWSNPAWLICVCEFRGRRRKVMGGRSWTELFFLDEATALAAGHRPCFYCRRDDANRFRSCWERGQSCRRSAGARHRHGAASRAVCQRQEAACRCRCRSTSLPDGTMVQAGDGELSVIARAGRCAGALPDIARVEASIGRDAMLITPPSTLRALASGYQPVLHPSCEPP